MFIKRLLFLFSAISVVSCLSRHPKLLLISFDGFRYDLLDEVLVRFAENAELILLFYFSDTEYSQMGVNVYMVYFRSEVAVRNVYCAEPYEHCHRIVRGRTWNCRKLLFRCRYQKSVSFFFA